MLGETTGDTVTVMTDVDVSLVCETPVAVIVAVPALTPRTTPVDALTVATPGEFDANVATVPVNPLAVTVVPPPTAMLAVVGVTDKA